MPANPKQITSGISGWPEDERPRERLLAREPHALADAELFAILEAVSVKTPMTGGYKFSYAKNFGVYFQYLSEGRIADYPSGLDVKLDD